MSPQGNAVGSSVGGALGNVIGQQDAGQIVGGVAGELFFFVDWRRYIFVFVNRSGVCGCSFSVGCC